jgi:hypothetical protein
MTELTNAELKTQENLAYWQKIKDMSTRWAIVVEQRIWINAHEACWFIVGYNEDIKLNKKSIIKMSEIPFDHEVFKFQMESNEWERSCINYNFVNLNTNR